MKKNFSGYAQEFNKFADVARVGNADDVRISYSVFVGDTNNEDSGFLDTGWFSADDFTTWSDAAKAKRFAETVLEFVDMHAKKNIATKGDWDNMRHAIYRCVETSVNSLLEYRKDKYFGAMLIAELTCNLNDILGKYRNSIHQ